MYKNIILPVVLCGHETWYLILEEEHVLSVLRTECWGEYLDLRGRSNRRLQKKLTYWGSS